ncbi:hypothetical protein [Rhodococcus sp. HNM0569]|uniref:hypothetical protein n=1 Tax=Rhodococcus sp. HNM0569 TaxID=2716340 RepID=UPI00146F744E|nr:hypothetical protein [Rhodococcus sp. HNM0569]NLU82846.1 hypothetical protein [Rhodococcus sp. HNM0569]
MTDPEELWYYNVEDGTVAQGLQAPARSRMGPYPDRDSAQRALDIAKERNKAADREDEEWQ